MLPPGADESDDAPIVPAVPPAARATDEEVRARALAEPRVAEHVEGKQMVKFVVVPGRLVSVVVK